MHTSIRETSACILVHAVVIWKTTHCRLEEELLPLPTTEMRQTEFSFDPTSTAIASNHCLLLFRLKINVSDLWGERKKNYIFFYPFYSFDFISWLDSASITSLDRSHCYSNKEKHLALLHAIREAETQVTKSCTEHSTVRCTGPVETLS